MLKKKDHFKCQIFDEANPIIWWISNLSQRPYQISLFLHDFSWLSSHQESEGFQESMNGENYIHIHPD